MANTKITSRVLADDAVLTANITDANVTTAKIADDAVTGAKIADDAINSEHYTDGSIDTAHIADAQITTAKLADANVTTAKIADDAITTAKIADNAVGISALNVSDGSDGQVLTTNGSGTLSFSTISAGVAGISTSADATAITISSSEVVTFSKPTTSDGHTSSVATIFEANANGDTVPVQLKVKANNGTTSTQGLYGNAGSASTDNTIVLGNSGSSGVAVDSSGRALIGTQTSPNNDSDNAHYAKLIAMGNTNSASGDGRLTLARGEASANLSSGDVLGMIAFADNTFHDFALIKCVTDAATGNDDNAGALTFETVPDGSSANAERMRITNDGKVMIGTTTNVSNANLTVDGGDMMVHGANNSAGISDLLPGYTRGDYGVIYSTANNIYFAVGSSYISYIAGGSGQYTISDERMKENVTTLSETLDKVKQLRGVSHTWKDTEKMGADTQIGMIAQEVETVYPELVGDGGLPNDNEGNAPMKSVNYPHLTSVLVEAIKELSTKLEAAEARIKTLEEA